MRWITWLLLAACSGGPAARGPAQPVAAARAPAAPAQIAATERECDELITHAVMLGIDERAARAGEPRTTQADHEAVRRSLREDFTAACRALSRDTVRCAIAATSLPALVACQTTPSSSTSNSRVAPGGMTPPAPRSP